VSPVAQAVRRTFKALRVRNYRLYFVGQIISASGTWMHTVALGLLVLSKQLHGNGLDVGLVTALQFLPILLFGSWGGWWWTGSTSGACCTPPRPSPACSPWRSACWWPPGW
jgi:hypothetical protein